MKIEEELQLRLMKQLVPLFVEQNRLKIETREKRKELYNVSWKIKEIKDEIVSLNKKEK